MKPPADDGLPYSHSGSGREMRAQRVAQHDTIRYAARHSRPRRPLQHGTRAKAPPEESGNPSLHSASAHANRCGQTHDACKDKDYFRITGHYRPAFSSNRINIPGARCLPGKWGAAGIAVAESRCRAVARIPMQRCGVSPNGLHIAGPFNGELLPDLTPTTDDITVSEVGLLQVSHVDKAHATELQSRHRPIDRGKMTTTAWQLHEYAIPIVRLIRLELTRLAAPDPKSGVSTNSTTSAN